VARIAPPPKPIEAINAGDNRATGLLYPEQMTLADPTPFPLSGSAMPQGSGTETALPSIRILSIAMRSP
jgi:hypothetical protein